MPGEPWWQMAESRASCSHPATASTQHSPQGICSRQGLARQRGHASPHPQQQGLARFPSSPSCAQGGRGSVLLLPVGVQPGEGLDATGGAGSCCPSARAEPSAVAQGKEMPLRDARCPRHPPFGPTPKAELFSLRWLRDPTALWLRPRRSQQLSSKPGIHLQGGVSCKGYMALSSRSRGCWRALHGGSTRNPSDHGCRSWAEHASLLLPASAHHRATMSPLGKGMDWGHLSMGHSCIHAAQPFSPKQGSHIRTGGRPCPLPTPCPLPAPCLRPAGIQRCLLMRDKNKC